MGLSDVWNRTLVYFGIAEVDDEEWDEDGYVTNEELERTYAERPNVRRLSAQRGGRDFDDWTDSEPAAAGARTATLRPRRRPELAPVPAQPGSAVRVHLVVPRSFNDAQTIADRFKRLIDFASGLTYALDGGMQRIADKVFLLTPANVEVSAEQRAQLLERGGFFNQA
jgi:cell division inhibitor SepF